MKMESLEARMRALEWFHSLRALPGAWLILRVDGRGFSRLTKEGFEKPFDDRFHTLMLGNVRRPTRRPPRGVRLHGER